MRVRIFTLQPPQGRCLILAQRLNQTTTLSGTQCVALAERLFAFVHQRENPAIVEILEPCFTEVLVATCGAFGISVEDATPEGSLTD